MRAAGVAVLMVAGSCAVAFGVGEIVIRLFAPQQLVLVRPDIWQPADTIGWVTRPNVRTRVNTGERTVDFVTDANGYRVGLDGQSHAASRNVLLIGDSFMQALQVEHEQTLASLLGARLTRALGTTVQVRNAAVAGWDPPQYLMRARTLLQRGRWDLLLVTLFTGNDIVAGRPAYFPPRSPAPSRRLRMPRTFSARELTNAWLYPLNNWLDEHSQLFVFVKERLSTLRMRLGLSAESVPTEVLRSEAASSRWSVTAAICRDIQEVARARGVQVLFVVIPSHYQILPERFRSYASGFGIDTASIDMDQPNRLLDEALRAQGVTVLDPLEELRKARRAGRTLYGQVDHHFNADGHDAFERAIEPAVISMLRR